jgi:hypothetical protein
MREIFQHPLFRLPYLRRFQGITLAPWWILYREPLERVDARTRRHEAEHLAQYRRSGFLPFYGTYLADWVRGLLRTRNLDAAYRQIRWEVLAYAAQDDPDWPAECADLPCPAPSRSTIRLARGGPPSQ